MLPTRRVEISGLRQAEGADIEKQDTEDGDAADKVQRDISLHAPCSVLVVVTYCAQELLAGILAGFKQAAQRVVVVALVASRMPRAFTQ
jgi:hypothetical protein